MKKYCLSGIVAFIILNLACLFYYNLPSHTEDPSKSTDYKWTPNKRVFKMTEGFAINKIDSNGYVNLEFPSKPIELLMMGSSQFEGINVSQKYNISSLLNSAITTYNIGISGHSFTMQLAHLENALKQYHPQKYVLLETQSLESLAGNDYKIPNFTANSLLIKTLQQLPYIRLLYAQYDSIIKDFFKRKTANAQSTNTNKVFLQQHLIDLKSKATAYGVTPILLFHTQIRYNQDGNLTPKASLDLLTEVQTECKKQNIIFINAIPEFLKLIKEHHVFPNGFSNTRVGRGHLNRHGNKVIADLIIKTIKENE